MAEVTGPTCYYDYFLRLFLLDAHARNEEFSSNLRTSMQSSFSEDSETPPPVPARRSRFDNRSINALMRTTPVHRHHFLPTVAHLLAKASPYPTPTDESRTSNANYASPPPPLPARPAPFAIPSSPASPVLSRTDSTYSSVSERKSLSSRRLPPPPGEDESKVQAI